MNSRNIKKGVLNDYLILVDDKVSEKSFNRSKIKRVIKWIEEAKVGTFIVYKLDRLSRKLIDLIELLEEISKNRLTS